MGEVVQFSDYQAAQKKNANDSMKDSMIPIEFAVGSNDRNECLSKIAEYGIRAIHIRMLNDEPDALLYLIGVKDAIWLNKKVLEREELSEEEIVNRIDLIQMLENVNPVLMDRLWESFTR